MQHRVKITRSRGQSFEGNVITSHNYGSKDKPDWYIELTDDKLGYVYFKQSCDAKFEDVKVEFHWR